MLPHYFPLSPTGSFNLSVLRTLSTTYQMLIVIHPCLAPLMDVICENQMRESMGIYFENYAVLSELKGPGMCLQQQGLNSAYYW